MKLKFTCSIFVAVLMLLASCASADNKQTVVPSSNEIWTEALAKYRADDSVRNLALVQCTGGSDARVLIFAKDDNAHAWRLVRDTDAFIGRNGYTDAKREGDGMTPVGDFGILSAFGILDAPAGCPMHYVKVNEYTYAIDGDNEFYNKIIDTEEGGPRQGEHMIDYTPEYNYGLALDYNKECVPGLGSNIFFHCKGVKPYTGGCVAVDEDVMEMIVSMFSSSDRVIIGPR